MSGTRTPHPCASTWRSDCAPWLARHMRRAPIPRRSGRWLRRWRRRPAGHSWWPSSRAGRWPRSHESPIRRIRRGGMAFPVPRPRPCNRIWSPGWAPTRSGPAICSGRWPTRAATGCPGRTSGLRWRGGSRAETGVRAWPQAHPYVLAHLATHAATAGKLGELVADPGYLAYAAPLGLRAAFTGERDPVTRLTAVAYERAMHRLRGNDLADRLSYLELAARRARAGSLADRIANYPLRRRWSVRWIHWPPDHPHRVLTGHQGPVREVVGLGVKDRTARAASVGDDGTLRLWDIGAAQQIVAHVVSQAALAAVDVVEFPGHEQLAVVLSGGGYLTAHELPSMSVEQVIAVRSGLRGGLRSLQLTGPEMRCVQLPDGRWAAVTGGPGMVTTIWDIRSGTPIVRLRVGLRPSRLEFRKLASGVPVVVSIDPRMGAEHVFDLVTGQHVPNVRHTLVTSEFSYFCRPDGTPVIGLLSEDGFGIFGRGGGSTLFDLTGPADEPRRG